MSSRARALRRLLEAGSTGFLLEAHNGLSARIAEEAGFGGLWASGLALSAQFGVRDCNEASWTQVLDMVEFMADACSIPILLDGDTGYGNFNNVRRLVRKLEQRSVAGVCLEDKVFPKTNSFLGNGSQELARVDEFCGKIRAGKESQGSPDFVLVARTEALIAGCGVGEALHRAEAYRQAGADAVMIHSKSRGPEEVLAFCREWAGRLPVVIAPTTYYSTPTEVFEKAGVSLVIWANPMVRAAVAAMTRVARTLQATRTLTEVEDDIAPMEELFRLQRAEELDEARRRYFPGRNTSAVVLAASRGVELADLTAERPKAMLPVAGRPLLGHLCAAFARQGVSHVTVVGGYRHDTIRVEGVEVLHNPSYEVAGELSSLTLARHRLSEDCLVAYGDLLLRSFVLQDLLDRPEPLAVLVDSALDRPGPDLAVCTRPDDPALRDQPALLRALVRPGEGEPHGRWVGMLRVRGEGRDWLQEALDHLEGRPDFAALGMPDLLNHLVERGRPVAVAFIHGHWLDVNRLEDLDQVNRLAPSGLSW